MNFEHTKTHKSIQINFRASTKWLQIVTTLARLEGRPASALMRELLTLGLAQYVNIHYRTPQLVREQQLNSLLAGRLQKAVSQTKAQASSKNDV